MAVNMPPGAWKKTRERQYERIEAALLRGPRWPSPESPICEVTEEFGRDELVSLGAALSEYRERLGGWDPMGTTVSKSIGRNVISRASAESPGAITRLIIDPGRRYVSSIVIGNGKTAVLAEWDDLSGSCSDAVVVNGESGLPPLMTDQDEAAAGKLAWGSDGNRLGNVSDVEFDPESAAPQWLVIGNQRVESNRLLGPRSCAADIAVTRT